MPTLHQRLKPRILHVIKSSPPIKQAWSTVEDRFAMAGSSMQRDAMKIFVRDVFKPAYEAEFGRLEKYEEAHVVSWLIEELNEGL